MIVKEDDSDLSKKMKSSTASKRRKIKGESSATKKQKISAAKIFEGLFNDRAVGFAEDFAEIIY